MIPERTPVTLAANPPSLLTHSRTVSKGRGFGTFNPRSLRTTRPRARRCVRDAGDDVFRRRSDGRPARRGGQPGAGVQLRAQRTDASKGRAPAPAARPSCRPAHLPCPPSPTPRLPCAMRTVCSPSERYVTSPFTTAITPWASDSASASAQGSSTGRSKGRAGRAALSSVQRDHGGVPVEEAPPQQASPFCGDERVQAGAVHQHGRVSVLQHK